MNLDESYFLSYNKLIEDKVNHCLHDIEVTLDRLFEKKVITTTSTQDITKTNFTNRVQNPLSFYTYLPFKSPYIKDFRNFSGPTNYDVQQLRDLTGTENIEFLITNKRWSRDSKKQLHDAVLDHYAQLHIIDLIKQKNILMKQFKDATLQQQNDLQQKLDLIEEQTEQVKSRKEQRIFVPEVRVDSNVDWCAISAKLTNTNHNASDCRLMWSNKLHWTINDGIWTKEEDVCLLNAVRKLGKNNWDSIAEELNSNRLPWQCCARYNQEFSTTAYGSKQLSEEDIAKILEVINLCRIGDYVPWSQVMYFIQYHSLSQVKYQWHKLIFDKKSSQTWSHDEDILLLRLIEKYGERDWCRISSEITGRSNKSCRERYIMRLKFSKRAIGNWTQKEDEFLLSLTSKFGTNWSLVSNLFPERNCHQLRSRYELLKNETARTGPIKRKKLFRDAEGFLVFNNKRRNKPQSEHEIDQKLRDIFSTYQTIKAQNRSLVCRSVQDELIYRNLVKVLQSVISGREAECNLLSSIIKTAIQHSVSSKYDLFTPCIATIKGYRAWVLYQDYLAQLEYSSIDLNSITFTQQYHQLLRTVVSLFLWPAILARIKTPLINSDNLQLGGIIEKDIKNLYKVREVQKQLVSTSDST